MAKKAQKKPPKPKPYSPAEVTQYPSEAAFNKTVNTRARSQLQPGLADIRARRKSELGANAARKADIQGYYDYDLSARNSAQTRLNEALTGILNRQDVYGEGAKEGLSAALRQSAQGNDAAAQQLGVQAPGSNPDMNAVLSSYNKANTMSLGGDFATYLREGAADIGRTGIERREAGEREMGEHAANMSALDRERTELMGTLPGLREGARSSLLQEILANSQNKLAWRQFGEGRRSNKAQEGLANKQFGLAEEQFGESKRARRFDEKMARKQATLNQDQLDLARDELNAKIDQSQTEEEMKGAETAAKTFDSAAEWLSGFLAPGDADMKYNSNGKKVFSPKKYQQRTKNTFNSTMDQLMTRFGLDLRTAYTLMTTAEPYKKKAQKFLSALPNPGEVYNGPH